MNELVQVALVGTAKHRGSLPETSHPAEALRSAWTGDAESALLLQAASCAVCDQCGYVPRADIPPVLPALAEDGLRSTSTLTGLIQCALATDSKELLLEFLRGMKADGLVFPADLLPEALALTDRVVREALLPVIGERGRWLSRFHPAWNWASGAAANASTTTEELQRRWEEGTVPERVRALESLRHVDPAGARECLSDVLAAEKADHRASLLETLETGLSNDDEAFLEQRLDDRSEQVRRLAAGFLARLSGSSLARRMIERGDPMLSAEKAGLIRRRLKLSCNPPEEIDQDWERDGISKKPPGQVGKRAFWAESVLALIPPSHWTRRFGAEAAALIAATEDDRFAAAVLAGWTRASAQFARGDAESAKWLAPIADHWATTAGRNAAAANEAIPRVENLLPLLPQLGAESIVQKMLDATAGQGHANALRLLAALNRPWTAPFALNFLSNARTTIERSRDSLGYQWLYALGVAGRALPQEAFAAALKIWQWKEQPEWCTAAVVREIERFTETIHLRQSYFAEVADIKHQALGNHPKEA